MENNNRRNFLKTGVVSGLALVASSAFGQGAHVSGTNFT